MNLQERERLATGSSRRSFRPRPSRAAAADPTISDILVNTPQARLRRAQRHAGADLDSVPRRLHLMQHHRPHRFRGRPPRRRIVAHGRCPPGRRLARQRHHSAARRRRPMPLDSPFRPRSADRRRSGRTTTRSPSRMLELLRGCVKARLNILISGGTGAGKTTLLNVLSVLHLRTANASSPSKTPPNCSCSSTTSCAWKRARQHRRQRRDPAARSGDQLLCVCGPTASSSARFAAKKRSTCSRP